MPNRVIKESIKRSAEIDKLTWFQEVVFYRLLVTVDDYGIYYADPVILRSDLFPTKEDVTKKSIQECIAKLEELGIIRIYEAEGRKYLQFLTWEKHQRIRNSVKKFPFPQCAAICGNSRQVAAENCGESESKTESKYESEEEAAPAREADDLFRIQREHDEVIQAAINAGYTKDPATCAKIIDLYAEFGKEKVLYAINESVEAQARNIVFLRKCCTGEGRKKVSVSVGKRVPAQMYDQRDYSGVQDSVKEMMERLRAEEKAESNG